MVVDSRVMVPVRTVRQLVEIESRVMATMRIVNSELVVVNSRVMSTVTQ